MKLTLLALYILLFAGLTAQRTDTFSIHKPPVSAENKFVLDTFVQQTYLTNKTEKTGLIVYRTGIKITGPNTLVYFKATQSILDANGLTEEKNASVGEFRKAAYALVNDSIFFLIKYQLPSLGNRNKPVQITKGYSGLKSSRTILMEINITSDDTRVPPKYEKEVFTLFKEDIVVTRKKIRN